MRILVIRKTVSLSVATGSFFAHEGCLASHCIGYGLSLVLELACGRWKPALFYHGIVAGPELIEGEARYPVAFGAKGSQSVLHVYPEGENRIVPILARHGEQDF
ncbi:hypothetical protein GKC30_14705 [Pseudodesulfovibrio sp. F-1]|uniref:Uncharacterized protein n=1 Tax=Pseudodesulfovibrio alkaliphilus TaxID=2661613 RepID=A0A7K1KSM8_9BACT|nr:hypothetical protein [Pseudodesulfovibrio alkaliphilus]MUM78881.1 hypothetical protein [Pseudodesulfovibrio alkaliphilus]